MSEKPVFRAQEMTSRRTPGLFRLGDYPTATDKATLRSANMDVQIAKALIDQTKLLLEDDATEWKAVEALWRPYVDQADVDAQFHLGNLCVGL